jgi:hypothetical protein
MIVGIPTVIDENTAIKLRKISLLLVKEGPGWLKKLILFKWLISTPSPHPW